MGIGFKATEKRSGLLTARRAT